MKLRVRCGSKCGGSQPRTRRIPPRLAGPTSPARSDAGLKRGSQAPPAIPLFSRSRRLRSGPVRGVLFRLCMRACRSALIPHPFDQAPAQRLYGFHPLHIRPNPRRSGAFCGQRLSTSAPRTLTLRPVAMISNHERGPRHHGRAHDTTSRGSLPCRLHLEGSPVRTIAVVLLSTPGAPRRDDAALREMKRVLPPGGRVHWRREVGWTLTTPASLARCFERPAYLGSARGGVQPERILPRLLRLRPARTRRYRVSRTTGLVRMKCVACVSLSTTSTLVSTPPVQPGAIIKSRGAYVDLPEHSRVSRVAIISS